MGKRETWRHANDQLNAAARGRDINGPVIAFRLVLQLKRVPCLPQRMVPVPQKEDNQADEHDDFQQSGSIKRPIGCHRANFALRTVIRRREHIF